MKIDEEIEKFYQINHIPPKNDLSEINIQMSQIEKDKNN